jgi:hypothetical protein
MWKIRYHILIYSMFFVISHLGDPGGWLRLRLPQVVHGSTHVFSRLGGCLNVFKYIPRFALSLGLQITHGWAYFHFGPCLFSSESLNVVWPSITPLLLTLFGIKKHNITNQLYVSGTKPPSLTLKTLMSTLCIRYLVFHGVNHILAQTLTRVIIFYDVFSWK